MSEEKKKKRGHALTPYKGGKEWKGNKLGSKHPNHPFQDPLRKQLKLLSSGAVHEIITMLLDCNLLELQKLAKDKKAPSMKKWIAGICVEGIKKNQWGPLNNLLDRSIGPVGTKLQLSGPNGGPIESYTLTPEQRRAAIEELRKNREKLGDD